MSKQIVSLLLFVYMAIACSACSNETGNRISFLGERVVAAPKDDRTKFPFEYDPFFIKALGPGKWIIADLETVWITNNGGQSWRKSFEPQDSDGKPPNVRGISLTTENILFLATDDVLFRSSDSGETWQRTGDLNFSANAIFFNGEKNGWATSILHNDRLDKKTPEYEGTIYSTDNGGITWKKNKIKGIETLTKRFDKWSLSDIVMFDSGKGFAVGDGMILQTKNFGEEWTIDDVEAMKYYKLGYLTENFVWAMTTGGYQEFLLTKDGGDKWQSISFPITGRDTAQFVTFTDEKTILAGLNNLYITTTEGKNWSKIENPDYLFYAELEKDGSLIALGEKNERAFTLKSTDKGKNWTTYPAKDVGDVLTKAGKRMAF